MEIMYDKMHMPISGAHGWVGGWVGHELKSISGHIKLNERMNDMSEPI